MAGPGRGQSDRRVHHEQAYNAQALVAADSLLVVTNDVVQAPNDKRQIEPALEALARLGPRRSAAFSEANGRLRRGRDRAVDHARPGTLEGPFAGRAAAPGEPDLEAMRLAGGGLMEGRRLARFWPGT